MARKRRTTRSEVTLQPVTRVATLTADDLPAERGTTAAEAAAARGAPAVEDVRAVAELLEYKPQPLPGQAARGALDGAAEVVGFRAAAAARGLPPVPITYDPASETWLLLADYSYDYAGHLLTAKAGFAFDLASVPRPLWWLIAPNELSISAPLFHDLLYVYQGRLPDETYVSPYRTYTRRETDDMFLHLMEVEGVARWRRYAAYSAVRSAGGIFWAT